VCFVTTALAEARMRTNYSSGLLKAVRICCMEGHNSHGEVSKSGMTGASEPRAHETLRFGTSDIGCIAPEDSKVLPILSRHVRRPRSFRE
jgi:hypothetical protein